MENFVFELTVGFETYLNITLQRKKEKYQKLLQTLNCQHYLVTFANQSLSCLGIFGRSADYDSDSDDA